MRKNDGHYSVKCPFCMNVVPVIPFGRGYVAICELCQRTVYNNQTLMAISDEEKRDENND